MSLVVAIDGPAGSGKSTVAAALAAALDVPHVDTGAYYRAAALAVLRAGADPADPDACLAALLRVSIERRRGRTFLNGQDVEVQIRGPAVTGVVSTVAAHPVVRQALLPLQQAAAAGGGVVEGRDAGTAVVPDAPLKVWLTASPGERALRRAGQLGPVTADAVAVHSAALARRDAQDAARMIPAADVVTVDTTGKDVGDVVRELAALARVRALEERQR